MPCFRDDEHAVPSPLGVIIMIAVVVVMAGVILYIANGLGQDTATAPQIVFEPQPDTGGWNLLVVKTGKDVVDWSELSFAADTTAACTLPTGIVDPGDVIVCTSGGRVSLLWSSASLTTTIYETELG